MMRTPLTRVLIDYGEDATYEPPAGADRFTAWRRSEIMPPFIDAQAETSYGGLPPQWVTFGGYDIAADEIIEEDTTAGALRSGVTGFAPTAGGFTAKWNTLIDFTSGLGSECLMVVAYVAGKATEKVIYAIPAPSATDAAVIAAQERRLLQSLLLARERVAGHGGIKSHFEGVEYENPAVLDRRISEVRARIVWFEAAEVGNTMPRQEHW